MANRHPGTAGPDDFGAEWAATMASLAVGSAFFALWFWLLPPVLGFQLHLASVARWRWVAAAPSVLGFAVAVRCVWNFGRTGHGTPAPMAPPQRLVVVGFYRYVRNPMYWGFLAGWTGLWIVFGGVSVAAGEVALGAIAAVGLFVCFYEEPVLRRKFGADYEEYCRNVPRWWPRLRPWHGDGASNEACSIEFCPPRDYK
jgi:protein-S-isoprenylcysteine O-methyltransferase Ste14